jgi:hypothetical protein
MELGRLWITYLRFEARIRWWWLGFLCQQEEEEDIYSHYRFLPSSHSFFDVMIEPDASCLSKAEDGRNEARGAQREKEAAQRAG